MFDFWTSLSKSFLTMSNWAKCKAEVNYEK